MNLKDLKSVTTLHLEKQTPLPYEKSVINHGPSKFMKNKFSKSKTMCIICKNKKDTLSLKDFRQYPLTLKDKMGRFGKEQSRISLEINMRFNFLKKFS